MPTHGGHSRFTSAQLAAVLKCLDAAIDAVDGSISLRFSAVVVAATRQSDAASECA